MSLVTVYAYFTLEEWKIINKALQEHKIQLEPEGLMFTEDKIHNTKINEILVKLPSASFNHDK